LEDEQHAVSIFCGPKCGASESHICGGATQTSVSDDTKSDASGGEAGANHICLGGPLTSTTVLHLTRLLDISRDKSAFTRRQSKQAVSNGTYTSHTSQFYSLLRWTSSVSGPSFIKLSMRTWDLEPASIIQPYATARTFVHFSSYWRCACCYRETLYTEATA
jgi:hypothetical protein